jgi:hypothetical protein
MIVFLSGRVPAPEQLGSGAIAANELTFDNTTGNLVCAAGCNHFTAGSSADHDQIEFLRDTLLGIGASKFLRERVTAQSPWVKRSDGNLLIWFV